MLNDNVATEVVLGPDCRADIVVDNKYVYEIKPARGKYLIQGFLQVLRYCSIPGYEMGNEKLNLPTPRTFFFGPTSYTIFYFQIGCLIFYGISIHKLTPSEQKERETNKENEFVPKRQYNLAWEPAYGYSKINEPAVAALSPVIMCAPPMIFTVPFSSVSDYQYCCFQ